MAKTLAQARKRIVTWRKIADFAGMGVRTLFEIRDRDEKFRKLLRRQGRCVFMFEDDAARYFERYRNLPY